MLGAASVVAVDHAPALRHLGVHPLQFIADTAVLFRPVAAEALQARHDVAATNTTGTPSQQ